MIQIETNPNLLTDPSLVIKIGDTYHKWDTAAPIIMSHVLYGRSLPLDLMEKLKEKSTFKRGKILVYKAFKNSYYVGSNECYLLC